MTLGTPSETYDADRAASLLKSVGQEVVDVAVKDMLERGVISKLVRDPKKNKPGRLLKISDLWVFRYVLSLGTDCLADHRNQNALGGPVATELFQDACALEEGFCSSLQEDLSAWKTWPLTASDGDTAALLELVSEGKVDFEIDATGPQSARAAIDWNSKKAGTCSIIVFVTTWPMHICFILFPISYLSPLFWPCHMRHMRFFS